MISIPRCQPPLRAALSVCALVSLVLSAASCSSKTGAPTDSTAAQSVRFVETDGWWSIEIPGNWQAVRIELDGDRTVIHDWPAAPSPGSRPMRDLNSTGVTYEFHEGTHCRQCTVIDRARVTVAAQPMTDVKALEREVSATLRASPGVQDFTARTFTCDGAECVAIAYVSQGVQVSTELRPAPAQERVYELRTTVPVQRLDDFKPVFERSLASFRAESRS